MLGQKIYKPILTQEQCDEYASVAEWCNENNCTIEDKGEYFEVVAIPAPALADIKESKIAEFKQARDAEELSPVSYRGYMWDFDDKAQQRINGAIIALYNGGSLTWTSADNQEIHDVDANDLRGVVGAAAVRSNMVHVKYRELKLQVEACETAEQVEAIVW